MLNLIELLMNQLLKLDGIMAEGDVKLQRKIQVMLDTKMHFTHFCVITNCICLSTSSSNGSETLFLKVKRVQKYVETLDLLKVKNSLPGSNGDHAPVQPQQKHSNGQRLGPVIEQQQKHSNGHNRLALAPIQEQQQQQQQPRNSNENFLELYHEEQHQPSRNSTSGVVVTTNWELFDFAPPLIPVASTSPPPPPPVANSSGPPKFNWELFN